MRKKHYEARLHFAPEDSDEQIVLFCEIKLHTRWVQIAKRYSGRGWVALEPGYKVSGSEPGADSSTICIEYDPAYAEAH